MLRFLYARGDRGVRTRALPRRATVEELRARYLSDLGKVAGVLNGREGGRVVFEWCRTSPARNVVLSRRLDRIRQRPGIESSELEAGEGLLEAKEDGFGPGAVYFWYVLKDGEPLTIEERPRGVAVLPLELAENVQAPPRTLPVAVPALFATAVRLAALEERTFCAIRRASVALNGEGHVSSLGRDSPETTDLFAPPLKKVGPRLRTFDLSLGRRGLLLLNLGGLRLPLSLVLAGGGSGHGFLLVGVDVDNS